MLSEVATMTGMQNSSVMYLLIKKLTNNCETVKCYLHSYISRLFSQKYRAVSFKTSLCRTPVYRTTFDGSFFFEIKKFSFMITIDK